MAILKWFLAKLQSIYIYNIYIYIYIYIYSIYTSDCLTNMQIWDCFSDR